MFDERTISALVAPIVHQTSLQPFPKPEENQQFEGPQPVQPIKQPETGAPEPEFAPNDSFDEVFASYVEHEYEHVINKRRCRPSEAWKRYIEK